jgi:CHAT domain-containing protein/Tfp pilus assembly protein PilF
MRRRAAAAALALAAAALLFALVRDPLTLPEIGARIDEAESLEERGDLDSAIAVLREAAKSARRRGDPALTAQVLNRLASLDLRRGENGELRALAEEALAAARRAGDAALESEALFNLGSLQYSFGRMREASGFFESSSEAARRASETGLEARAELYVGQTAVMMEERTRAETALGRARALSHARGDGRGEAEAVRVLGQLYSRLGENQKALDSFEKARGLLAALDDPAAEAAISNAVGQLYFDMGEIETALDHYLRALALNRSHLFRRREAATLLEVGRSYLELGRRSEARTHLEGALAIYRELENPRLEADVLAVLGRLEAASGEESAALRSFGRAAELKTEVGDARGRAFVLEELGSLHRALGRHSDALRNFREAAERSREADDPLFESQALYHAATAYRDLSRLEEARDAIEESIRLAETLRASVASHGLRTSFLASVHERYSFYIDVLIRLNRARPEEGLDALAFQTAERVRARTLRESLQEAAAGIRAGIAPEIRERERELRRRLGDLALSRELATGDGDLDRLRAEIAEATDEYDRLQSTIRTRNPRYASLTEPVPVTLTETRALLDAETRLLAYHLGNERSFLWSLGRDEFSLHELPSSGEIESLAREVYASWKSPGAREASSSRLARTLLGPIEGFRERRLVIVAGGALGFVPFGALEDPRTQGKRLVDSVEIARLPSVSLIDPLRKQRAGRTFRRSVAVAADPAYGGALPRLPESGREASRIAALAPPGSAEVAVGFQARREWIEATDFASFRFLHLAAHAVVDDERPELSGIALSLVGEDGGALNGFLRLPDIYNLTLPVDLVVLSACETGLGKEVRGEGFIGLVRGFLYAGAPAVIASSWKVDDRSTAELMTELYRGLFRGLRPAAALREAQLAVSKAPRFRHPYYWAAFELQGDWQ